MHFQPQNITKSPYPFGMIMPERTWSSDSVSYGFGFNGQMKDDEIYGAGNSYTAEYWQYDARLGRRWNVDPRPNPSISPYACFKNNPIFFVDVFGDTLSGYSETEQKALENFEKRVDQQVVKYENKVQGLNKQLENQELSKRKIRGLKKELKSAESSLSQWQEVKNELEELHKSKENYVIRMGENVTNKVEGGNLFYNNETGDIDINIISNPLSEYSFDQKLAHELKHAFQFSQFRIAFDAASGNIFGDTYSKKLEIEAYQRLNLIHSISGEGKSILDVERYVNFIHGDLGNTEADYNAFLKMKSRIERGESVDYIVAGYRILLPNGKKP
jgi:RHS repeat-associated protein